jgi:hypothetical protein
MSLSAILWVTISPSTTATNLRSFARSAGIRKGAVMQRQLSESTNEPIMNNGKGVHDWVLNDLIWEIYWWIDFFNIAFFKVQPVPVPAISFEKTRVTNLGRFVAGRNAFDIKDTINLNSEHLNRPLWDILATLLHEMTHSWQAMYGKPSKSWFHNKEFRLKMMELGIISDTKGYHIGIGDPFVFLLKKHGIVFNGEMKSQSDKILKIPPRAKPKGQSKLKKWSCECTNIRVAVKEFEAKCLRCGSLFELGSSGK